MRTREIPKTITLRFLKKYFRPNHIVFEFWGKYFAINNTPLLEDFIKSCWKNMKPIDASFVVEIIINLFLDSKMKNLYDILNNNMGEVGNKYKEWEQIDLSFIKFLTQKKENKNV